jgi:hypothetical protein
MGASSREIESGCTSVRRGGIRRPLTFVVAAALVACSSNNTTNKSSSGAGGVAGVTGTGGAPGVGVAGSGGLASAGGSASGLAPGNSGGAQTSFGGPGGGPASGGQATAGGAPGTAGAPGAGGAPGIAGASGAPGAAGASEDAGTTGDACSRDALKTVIGDYFTAMAAHNPSTLKVASSVKFTENAKQLSLGDGIWKTAGAVAFHRDVIDTERCGTVSEAVVDNSGTATIFGLRLKLESGQITEVETIVVDPKNGFFPTPMGIVNSSHDDWESVLPADQRSTRAQLSAAANAYFDLFSNSSAMPPFAKPCNRLENGLQTTQGDCSSGIPAGNLMMTHRRYPVADLEAGIAVGWVLFGGGLLDFHMFKLKGGKIEFINAVVGPSATSWGWPDDPPSP